MSEPEPHPSKIILSYTIFVLSEGHLVRSIDKWGEEEFSREYPTMDEATHAIDKVHDWGRYFILPTVSRSHILPGE